MADNQALTKTTNAQAMLDEAPIDPRLAMAAKAIQVMAGTDKDGKPKLTADQALAAALYQAGTGQLLGRDFYMAPGVGKMEGYRGVSRDAVDRGVGEVQIKYRPLTAEEATEHEVQPGDVAAACEVYQLRAWKLAQQIGQPYQPIIGIGIVREIERYEAHEWKTTSSGKRYKAPLPREQWKPIYLEGGMTWRKKANNRAYKEALRHVPGAPASADEVLEEATLRGMTAQPPEQARLTIEQAVEWVRQNEVKDGEFAPDGNGYDANADLASIPGAYEQRQPAAPQPAPQSNLPFRPTIAGAVEWAMQTHPAVWPVGKDGTIVREVVERSFRKLMDGGLRGEELAQAWITKCAEKQVTFDAHNQPATPAEPEPADVVEVPLFS